MESEKIKIYIVKKTIKILLFYVIYIEYEVFFHSI